MSEKEEKIKDNSTKEDNQHFNPNLFGAKNKKSEVTTSDSKTFDVKAKKPITVMHLSDKRSRVTIRVKPELKEALSSFCVKNGLSLCHVFELLISGYLSGVGQKINFDVISPTIELSVIREVKRVRRYAREDMRDNEKFFCEGKTITDWDAHHKRLAAWKRSQLR